MTNMDMDLNKKIMYEIGLDVDNNQIIDQDSQNVLNDRFGKPYVQICNNRYSTEFNPACNSRLMEYLFGYYFTKMNVMEGSPYIISYFTQEVDIDTGMGYVEAILSDGTVCRSLKYVNPVLRYVDIILKQNGFVGDLYPYEKTKGELVAMRRKSKV